MDDARLPVPVTVHGPLKLLSLRVHELTQTGRCHEALVAADAYTAIARAVGDDKLATYLYQGRMYAYEGLGRLGEAIAAGEELLRRHRLAGNRLHEAKTLADLASLYLLTGRVMDGITNLARSDRLLDGMAGRDVNYASALGSYGAAVHTAGLYEAAQSAYERLAQSWAARDRPDFASGDELAYMAMLLAWGLRLDQLGYGPEAAVRLRRSAAIAQRWIVSFTERGAVDQVLDLVAARALALAKLGEIAEAKRLAEAAVIPLRQQEDHYSCRIAHLALGVVLRAEGDFAGARREFLAAEQMLHVGGRTEERLIIRYELAALAAEAAGTTEARDLFDTVREQARQLWQVRLERVGLLRQAQHREELESERIRAERALVRDPLTGLGNRRQFDRLMERLDAGTMPQPTTLVLLDLDRFKAINDTYSHAVGDQVLRAVAAAILEHCRTGDLPIRYAGDEFCIFLRADLADALGVAERIRAAVRAADFGRVAPDLSASVSVGVALLRSGMTAGDLFSAADHSLYQAKRAGRDRVEA
jgi:diguanylate cyclase (GGDEF)-like protein